MVYAREHIRIRGFRTVQDNVNPRMKVYMPRVVIYGHRKHLLVLTERNMVLEIVVNFVL